MGATEFDALIVNSASWRFCQSESYPFLQCLQPAGGASVDIYLSRRSRFQFKCYSGSRVGFGG